MSCSYAVAGQFEQAMPTIPEPHGSWVNALSKEWLVRYGTVDLL